MAKIKELFVEFYEHYCSLDSMFSDFTHAALPSDIELSSEVVVKKQVESEFINMMKTHFKKLQGNMLLMM